MKFDLLTVLLLAGIPICAATAASLTKYLASYPLSRALAHPFFLVVLLMGAYEFFAGWYLYRPGVLNTSGAPMSVVEPVIVFSNVLVAILIGVGWWKESINSTQAIVMALIVPLLTVALIGRVPRLF